MPRKQQPRLERAEHGPAERARAEQSVSKPPFGAFGTRRRVLPTNVFRPTTAPATTSEWPLRYFVALCMTRSAPNFKGLHTNGVKTVASQHTVVPHFFATVTAAMTSVTRHVGLEGVSIHKQLTLAVAEVFDVIFFVFFRAARLAAHGVVRGRLASRSRTARTRPRTARTTPGKKTRTAK
jgi:hypothetical protein